MGVAARVRRQDHGAVPAHRRVARLPPRAVHDGRGLRASGDALLRPPVEQGLDLPRQPDRQLVPVPSDVAVRPRGGARRRGRCAHVRPLSVRRGRRSRDDRDRQAGDDPRRRRGRGSPGGRALCVCRRPARDRSVGRATRPGDRRRARRDGLRDGGVEDHTRPRSEGLRDRPRPRAARADGDRPRRLDERRGRRARGPHPGRGRRADPRLAARARPAREARGLSALGRALRSLQEPDRAADLVAVVVLDGGAEAARARGARVGPGPVPSGVATPVRDRLARRGPGLEHLAADLVGASTAALGMSGRPLHRAGGRAVGLPGVRLVRAHAQRGRSRYVVLVGALAVRDARLARRHRGPAHVLPGRPQHDRARHHSPLGEPDDLRRPRADGRRAVPRRRHPLARPRARPAGGCRRASAPA